MKFWIRASMAASVLFCLIMPLQGQDPSKIQPPMIRVGEDGVFVRVLITDVLNRYITGLGKEHFQVYENGVKQTLLYFAQKSAPLSIAMVFDLTASMQGYFDSAVLEVQDFLKSGNPEDAYVLVSFDEKAARIQDFTSNVSAQKDISFSELTPPSRPPLHVAIGMGLNLLMKGTNEKKALIIISDREIVSSLPAIQTYVIHGFASWNWWGSKLPQSATATGVRRFLPGSPSELGYYINLIQDELRNQYVLGYSPTIKNRDGKWRKIEVRFNPPKDLPKLSVIASRGYYALKK